MMMMMVVKIDIEIVVKSSAYVLSLLRWKSLLLRRMCRMVERESPSANKRPSGEIPPVAQKTSQAKRVRAITPNSSSSSSNRNIRYSSSCSSCRAKPPPQSPPPPPQPSSSPPPAAAASNGNHGHSFKAKNARRPILY